MVNTTQKNKTKLLRIANCLSELLNKKSSLKFGIEILIPLNVFQNLVWNNDIDSGKKLSAELTAAQESDYEVLHYYPASVLTRDYARPLIPIITGETQEKTSFSLPFPCTVKCIYDKENNNKLTAYLFTVNRELYLAQRLEPVLQKYYSNNKRLRIPHRVFSELLQSSVKEIEEFSSNYYNNHKWSEKNDLISDKKLIKFTYNHVIPVTNYLNDMAQKKACDFKYSIQAIYKKVEKNKLEITYKISFKKATYTPIIDHTLKNPYINLMDNQLVIYNKLSKWTYLIHVYIMNKIKFEMSYVKLSDNNNTYFITELEPKKVWDFWFNSPIKNHSYYAEFSNAVEELRKMCVTVLKHDSSDSLKILISNKKSAFSNLYKIYVLNDGKYCVRINGSYMSYMLNNNRISSYPKEFAHISSKTHYSQIRLFEVLYQLLPYDCAVTDPKIKISIPELAIITGHIDIQTLITNNNILIDKSYTTNFFTDLYQNAINTDRATYDLSRFFIQSINQLNYKLKESESKHGYIVNFQNPCATNSYVPTLKVFLKPIDEVIKSIPPFY